MAKCPSTEKTEVPGTTRITKYESSQQRKAVEKHQLDSGQGHDIGFDQYFMGGWKRKGLGS